MEYIIFVLLAACPALAWAEGCPTRPPTAHEIKAQIAVLTSMRDLAPAAPQGWKVREDTKIAGPADLCRGAEGSAMRFVFNREYVRVEGMQAKQAQWDEELADIARHMKATAAKNKTREGEINKKLAEVEKRMKAAVEAKHYDQIDPLSKEMAALSEQKSALLQDPQAEARLAKLESDRHKDLRAVLKISANQGSVALIDRQPVRIPGADMAYASTRQKDGNPETELVALVGAWRLQGGYAQSADSPLQGRPHTGVYAVEVSVEGDPVRTRQILDQVDLGRLKRLLSGASAR